MYFLFCPFFLCSLYSWSFPQNSWFWIEKVFSLRLECVSIALYLSFLQCLLQKPNRSMLLFLLLKVWLCGDILWCDWSNQSNIIQLHCLHQTFKTIAVSILIPFIAVFSLGSKIFLEFLDVSIGQFLGK